ncbi:hypothetical protein FRB90_000757, partial [Tulasnella sp. 427]
QQQQQPAHYTMFNGGSAPPPPRSTSPWGGSGSSFSSPIEPTRAGFLQTFVRASPAQEGSHQPYQQQQQQLPATTKVSPLKQRLRTSGLFPTSPSKQPSSSSKKLHYTQPSLSSFDGGIGESPIPGSSRKGKERASVINPVSAVKEKEKEKEKIRKKEKESGWNFPSYYSASPPPPPSSTKRHSPLSPLMSFTTSSNSHQGPTIGKALGVRTSLLGFGTESPLGMWDTSSPVCPKADAKEMFDRPRKAPLPPGHTPSPSTTEDERGYESHSRKPSSEAGGGFVPGGPSMLGPVREESEGQLGTSQEGSGERDDQERLSPVQAGRQYVVVTPPPPQDDALAVHQDATVVPLPPSASTHQAEESRQPSPTSTFPSPISPMSPTHHFASRTLRTPNEGSGSTAQKPPIPPKSAGTIRLTQGGAAKMLKGYSSTPNLLVAAAYGSAAAAAAAAGDVDVSPSKGKGKDKVQVDETLNTQRSPPTSNVANAVNRIIVPPHMLQAQTICDALMFPKPRFVAHVISPPSTPDVSGAPVRPATADPLSSTSRPPFLLPEIVPTPPLSLDKVLKEGEQREKERDQWAAKAGKGFLSRNPSTRSRAYTDASGGGGSQRDRNLSVTSASTGGGIVNRLRARTLSGRKGKGHKRGDSKDTQQTSEAGEYEGGARIGGRTGTIRGLKKETSYEFDTLRQRQMPRESPTPTATTKPVPLGKQGKLSISLNEKDQHQVAIAAPVATDSGGTVRSTNTNTNTNTTHSRKSSGQSRHIPFSTHPFASHSRSGSSGSVSAGAASAASYAIRKVKSLCGPEKLSPAAEEMSFVGGSEEKKSHSDARPAVQRSVTAPRETMYEDRMMEALSDRPLPIVVPQRQEPVLDDDDEEEEDYGTGERHLVDPTYEVGVALGGGDASVPASARDSAVAAVSHRTAPSPGDESLNAPSPRPDTASSHLDMDDADDETAQIHHVTRHVSMSLTPAHSRQSTGAVGGPSPIEIPNVRPVPTPSPSPSSYNGVYGIAIGTPNFNHPFAQSNQDPMAEVSTLPAGPHPTSPTYLQLPMNDLVARHRLPPHRGPIGPPPNMALPTPPVSSEHHESQANNEDVSDTPSEYDDEPSSLKPIYTPSSFMASTSTLPPRRNAHPYAVHSPAPSLPRNYRMSVNSVEAMFGGELLESSHTVSPLGVREAGESWVNSTEADLKGLSTPAEEDEYRHSGDSGLGSSTEIYSQRPPQSRHTRAKPSRAATQSSIGSMLIESPPPSMFPSFRQNRDSSAFDTMTFGPGDDYSVYEGDRSRPLSEIIPDPPAAATAHGAESISTSSTSSIELQSGPLGSSDDLDSFKDLFYVPRSRQPSASSPRFRRSEASGDSKLGDADLHEIEAYARSLPNSEPRSRTTSLNRILSPLSSVLEMRQSFQPDLDSPYRQHSLEDPNETAHYNGYFPPRASVYDIMEEDESVHSVSSVERNTEEDVRVGTVNVSATYVTAGRTNRQSTQPSLFDDDTESPLPAMPRTRPSFLESESANPAYRVSYMTTTSGTSLGNRMSHIISDFPAPPLNSLASSGFLDCYTTGGSQAATPDPHSFNQPPLVPRAVPFRSDSFGPQT